MSSGSSPLGHGRLTRQSAASKQETATASAEEKSTDSEDPEQHLPRRHRSSSKKPRLGVLDDDSLDDDLSLVATDSKIAHSSVPLQFGTESDPALLETQIEDHQACMSPQAADVPVREALLAADANERAAGESFLLSKYRRLTTAQQDDVMQYLVRRSYRSESDWKQLIEHRILQTESRCTSRYAT